jgi:hypothetical protein
MWVTKWGKIVRKEKEVIFPVLMCYLQQCIWEDSKIYIVGSGESMYVAASHACQ